MLEIIRRKFLGSVPLVQLSGEDNQLVQLKDGTLLRSPMGQYRVRHKPEFGDWVELRVLSGELPKDYVETVE